MSVDFNQLGLHVLAPCPHAQACPLTGPCHDVRTWKLTQTLQILNSSLHRDLRHLAFAFLVLSPEPPAGNSEIQRVRLVGSPAHAKGQTLCPACCSDGRIHRLPADEVSFRQFHEADPMAKEKLHQGIVDFSSAAVTLEAQLAQRMAQL